MRYFFLTYTKYACEKLPFSAAKSQAESSPPICAVLPKLLFAVRGRIVVGNGIRPEQELYLAVRIGGDAGEALILLTQLLQSLELMHQLGNVVPIEVAELINAVLLELLDRKSTRLNSSH